METTSITANQTNNNSIISARIEKVDDPKINKILFSLYERLVIPFKDIENQQEYIEQLNNDIECNKAVIKKSVVRILKLGIIIAIVVLVIIITLIMTLYQRNQIITQYLDWVETRPFYVFLTFAVVPLVLGFGISIALYLSINQKLKNDNARTQDEIDKNIQELSKKIETIQDVACFIPPSYRYSAALEFFVDAYANSKVDNLKEAVNLCDTNNFRENMIQSQRELIEMLQGIAFTQLEQEKQLNRIERSVWLSDLIF